MLDSRLVKQAIGCLAAFFGVNPGEALSALANILGGIIGALGAALAVYLTLKGQRKDARRQQEDERQRTSSAINREVAEFSRLAIGHLEICEHMHSGTTMIPARDLPAIMKLPEPIIYAGNADNIGRLANAQTVVGFFTRIHEVESLTRIAAQSFGPMPLDQSKPRHSCASLDAYLPAREGSSRVATASVRIGLRHSDTNNIGCGHQQNFSARSANVS